MKNIIKTKSKIIWLSGLSGSGKSTLANILYRVYTDLNFKCTILDGDIFRERTRQKSFKYNDIIKNNQKIINYCKKIQFNYDFIFVSVISPIRKTRSLANKLFKKIILKFMYFVV